MDKLTAIKIKYDDGTYSDEIPVSVLAENVEWDSTHTLVDVLGSIDVDVAGAIQDQISQLFYEKANSSEVAALKSRIDNFTKLESGSTTGDAELADIRVGADGKTYETAGDAVREQTSQLYESIVEISDNQYNLIKNQKLKAVLGAFEKGSINSSGQNVDDNHLFRSTGMIKIYNVYPYTFKTINGNGLVIRIYDSNGVYVRTEYMAATATERSRTITFQSTDVYFRLVINAYNNDYANYPVARENLESVVVDVSASIINKQYVDTKASDVLIKCFSGYGSIYHGNIDIDSVNGTISADGIRVLTNKGKFIFISDGTVSFDKTVAVYIGFEMSDARHSIVARKLDNVMSNDFIMLFAYHNKKIWFADKLGAITIDSKKYTDSVKTICCLGDSFTASSVSWHTFIGNNLGYNMVNLGVAGTRISNTYTVPSGTKYVSFIDRVANGALDSYSPDLIVIFGGINDTVKLHNNQMRIGTVTDEAEYSASVISNYSFIGRVKYLINLIKEKKPSASILGIIPPDYSEGGNDWWYSDIEEIRRGLREVYEYYGIPYVDLKKNCQEMYVNTYNLANYRTNGTSNMHPSQKGYKAIGKVIQKRGIELMFTD